MLKHQRERERERERERVHLISGHTQKGGQAVVFAMPSERLPKGGQRYSLIGGDSYGC